jgi:hypothetical protein
VRAARALESLPETSAAETDAAETGGARSDAAETDAAETDEIDVAEAAPASASTEGLRCLSGTRAERYQVVLHVEASTLQADTEPGRSHFEDGTRVAAETSRRLACDTGLVVMTWAKNSTGNCACHGRTPLDVGRRRRTIPPSLRRALEERDGGCHFPGCGIRFTEAHHIRHRS